MEDDAINLTKSKEKTESTSKTKDGYMQLAEKMEQVRSQMAKMERKYDELFRVVKEKEYARSGSLGSEQAELSRSQRESVAEATSLGRSSVVSSPNISDKASEEVRSDKPEMDIEKMEDNPFL